MSKDMDWKICKECGKVSKCECKGTQREKISDFAKRAKRAPVEILEMEPSVRLKVVERLKAKKAGKPRKPRWRSQRKSST